MTSRVLLLSTLALCAASGASFGAGELILVGDGIGITDMSWDGRVVVGNTVTDGNYETFRWVQGDPDGWQRLGLATVPVLGTGAGSPNVSDDGARVSATILGGSQSQSRAEPYATAGLWTNGAGWHEMMPPTAPDGKTVDGYYGSAWGLSGDGAIVSGLYWKTTGRGSPCCMTNSGVTPLDVVVGRSGRANASNLDGSVIVGWEERPDGPWRPTAWRNGVKITLADTPVLCTAEDVNGDGSVIVGTWYNAPADRRQPARWVWNGASYDQQDLGVLPNTPQTFIGYVYATGVTDDGSTVVGMNKFNNNGPTSNQAGFVWTQATGIRNVVDVMADEGVTLPAGHRVVGITISPDGSAIGLMCWNTAETQFFDYKSYVFRFTPVSTCAGDVNGDGVVNSADFNTLASNFGAGPGKGRSSGDLTDDGWVNSADFNVLAASFGCADIPAD